MKVIIAGSRNYKDNKFIFSELDKILTQEYFHEYGEDNGNILCDEIISGGARGVDTCSKHYAIYNKVKYREFKADWKTHGKSAGPIRNEEMAKEGDMLIAFWDGRSKGTKDMIDRAFKNKLKIYIIGIYA